MSSRAVGRFVHAVAAVALGCVCWVASAALAQAPAVERADSLFKHGKELMAQGDYAHACPLLEDSFRLDPATGGLLAVAACHEREGKLASAMREYTEVAERSQREARVDRETAARERAAALLLRVSTLRIRNTANDGVHNLAVSLNGVPVDAAALGGPIPVDGETIFVAVAAEGKETYRTSVLVRESGDAVSLTIPRLLEMAPPPVVFSSDVSMRSIVVPMGPPSRKDAAVEAPPSRPSAAQWVGITTTVVGVTGLATGFALTLRAIGKNDRSKSDCEGNQCGADGLQDRLDARSLGNKATVALVVGGTVTAVGLTTLVFARHARRQHAASARRSGWAYAPWLMRDAAGAVVEGRF